MREELRWGRKKYISFILLDLLCLILANLLGFFLYSVIGEKGYAISEHFMIVPIMVIIDLCVTIILNTLDKVLRRKWKKEILESTKHVLSSFVILALALFSLKRGSEYSRITIYLVYVIYLMLLIIGRSIWKKAIQRWRSAKKKTTSLMVTTAGYMTEGLNVLKNKAVIKGIFVTDKTNEGKTEDEIPIIVDSHETSSFICWMMIDRVYICGPEGIDVPETILKVCKEMDIPVYTAPTQKRFEYETVKIRTAYQKGDPTSGLSFFEGEHDIPFRISRLYTIFEKDQRKQTGFHPHKQSWHLIFCPYGAVDVYIDTGKEQKHILLDNPAVGLILHPSVWREMQWTQAGSVLCVAASGHYGMETLHTDFQEYLQFLKKKEWSAVAESSEFIGEALE